MGMLISMMPSSIQPRQSCKTLFHAAELLYQVASLVGAGSQVMVSHEILTLGFTAMTFRYTLRSNAVTWSRRNCFQAASLVLGTPDRPNKRLKRATVTSL